jgi:dephospho-CoA kinase
MLRAGVTGGIGSGKSVVCQVFRALGIPVFNADNAARYLMENDEELIGGIRRLLGDDVYTDGKLNRARVSAMVFNDREKLMQLNALVHPATIRYSRDWFDAQHAPYVIKEAAILFESGSYKDVDVTIGVFAPVDLRIQRAMQRSQLSREEVLSIMSRQMDEEEKMKRCDHVIINDDLTAVLPQVLELHELLLKGNPSQPPPRGGDVT